MTKQTKLESFIEALVNTSIGYVINFFGQLVIFPLVGITHVSIKQNLMIGILFTVLSIGRGYMIRRFFNNLQESIRSLAKNISIKFKEI